MFIKILHQPKLGSGMMDLEGISPSSIQDLFDNHDKYLSMIPTDKKFNCHYTIHEEGMGEMNDNSCYLYPLDFDKFNMDLSYLERHDKKEFDRIVSLVMQEVSARTKVPVTSLGAIFSGHGIHILILSKTGFKVGDFSDLRLKFNEVAADINIALMQKDLYCEVDLGPFRIRGTLRFPGCDNTKEDKQTVSTFIIQKPKPVDFSLSELVRDTHDYLENTTVDMEAVITGCEFLKQCIADPHATSRDDWFMATGIMAYLPNGRNFAHNVWMKDAERYKEEEIDKIVDGWTNSYGAPKCSTIEAKTGFDCATKCKHFSKCRTPLGILPEGTIASERQGFRKIRRTKDGGIKYEGIFYEDVIQAFIRDRGDYVVTDGTHRVYVWKGTHYEHVKSDYIMAYCMQRVIDCRSAEAKEFFDRLVLNESKLIPADKLNQGKGKINFMNNILDIAQDEERIIPHDKSFLFTHTLAYNYDPNAKCSKFEKFMDDITLGDKKMQETIMEFIGYGLSGDPSSLAQKALFFVGEGQNGKSTLTKIIETLAGKPGYSSVTLEKLDDENARRNMVGKLFNISSETKSNSLKNPEIFKMIAAGESVTIKELYSDKSDIHINAKLITACNKMPTTYDSSNGTYRRILYIPFDAFFAVPDPKLADKILADEVPGIIAWAVRAYKNLRANDYVFTVSERSIQQVEDYKSENPVQLFVDDCIDYSLDNILKASDIYASYKSYCETNNYKIVPANVLGRELNSVMSRSFKNEEIQPVNVRRSTERVWKHLKLRTLEQVKSKF